jgi:hypothetical protein
MMVSNSTNINNMNNYLQYHVIDHNIIILMKMQVLAWDRYKNVSGFPLLILDPNSINRGMVGIKY